MPEEPIAKSGEQPRLPEAVRRAISDLQQSGRDLQQGNRSGGESSGRSAANALVEAVLELRPSADGEHLDIGVVGPYPAGSACAYEVRAIFTDKRAYLEQYQADPDVEYAEPNHLVEIAATPTDPDFSKLWGLHNTGQTGGTPGADIKAEVGSMVPSPPRRIRASFRAAMAARSV